MRITEYLRTFKGKVTYAFSSGDNSINFQNDIELMKMHIRSSILLRKECNFEVHELSEDESKEYLNIPDYVYDFYHRNLITIEEFNEIISLYSELTYIQIIDETLQKTDVKLVTMLNNYDKKLGKD